MHHGRSSTADIIDALDRLAGGRSLADCALVQHPIVQRRMRDAGVVDASSVREWALGTVLSDIIRGQLNLWRRGSGHEAPGRQGPSSPHSQESVRNGSAASAGPDRLGPERRALEADFLAENPQREAWSCIFYRYVHVPALQAQELAAIVRPNAQHGRKLISRRTSLGIRLFSAVLIELELSEEGSDPQPDPQPDPPIGTEPSPLWGGLPGHLSGILRHVLANALPLDLPRAEARRAASHAPTDLTEYRLTRIAAWCRARYALDRRFVALSLLVDRGEDAPGGRWLPAANRYSDLADVLAAVPDPALVLLGAPGSGKSTLLRRFELGTSVQAVRAVAVAGGDKRLPVGAASAFAADDLHARDTATPVTFFVDLGRYTEDADGLLPGPLIWLEQAWHERFPHLPAMDILLSEGRVILLLDALNEIPHTSPADYRHRIQQWRLAILQIVQRDPGNRVVFSCRSLDYSAPLSSPDLLVAHVQVEPLDDARVRAFLEAYSPEHADDIWTEIAGRGQADLLRTPYFLKLLTENLSTSGRLPEGPAALITDTVRGALKREIERVNPLFDPGPLIAERDYWRVVQARAWTSAHDLPERGALFPSLAGMAYGMQRSGMHGEAVQVRLPYDHACAVLDALGDGASRPLADDILRAGASLGVLDDDADADEVRFTHQRLQEYFAARRLVTAPEPALVEAPWQSSMVRPSLRDLMGTLPAGETLPPLPQTGWEETTMLAAAMADNAEPFVRDVMATSLVVAARCANLPEVRGRLPAALLEDLRWALVKRSRDPGADLRARIAAGLELGWLGDPRFERRSGAHGEFLMPPLVEIPGGAYPIGSDEPVHLPDRSLDARGQMPQHKVVVPRFHIGQFAVTNAEWACFMAADGYEDPRWWDTASAKAWQRGEGTSEGMRWAARHWRRMYRDRPGLYEEMVTTGQVSGAAVERWGRWPAMPEIEFEAEMCALATAGHMTEPGYWHDPRINQPSQPVAGISWFELRAYCNWLSAQSGLRVRMLTEVEWEAAARGGEGRAYAFGDDFDPLCCNTLPTRLHLPAPIGTFPEGDTPEGACEMCGNVASWTSSALTDLVIDADGLNLVYAYPYTADDGRECPELGNSIARVGRGGSWNLGPHYARATYRGVAHPAARIIDCGGRVAVDAV